jgi:hypothetical protein
MVDWLLSKTSRSLTDNDYGGFPVAGRTNKSNGTHNACPGRMNGYGSSKEENIKV